MALVHYEFGPTRSQRVRWTLLELNLPFESRDERALIGSEELKQFHPLGKLPALVDNGRPLFESAAICTWLADSHPDKELIYPSGTWERALHDQWCAYVMTEVEAHLWNSARNTFVYPEDKRIEAVHAQNAIEIERALGPLDAHFASHPFLVADKFTVADIFAGFATNWARRLGHLEKFVNVQAYNQRLLEMPKCPYTKEFN
ncbi:MAG: glutathione S-transferase family protein [Hyphomicrobiaceae bacterium]